MSPAPDPADAGDLPIQCEACQSALHSHGRETISFLLLDQLTVPLVGCDDHLGEFASICGLSTEASAELLEHLPAGGIRCPGCRLASHDIEQPVLSVADGGVAVLACQEHETELVERFRTGMETRDQLTTSLDAV